MSQLSWATFIFHLQDQLASPPTSFQALTSWTAAISFWRLTSQDSLTIVSNFLCKAALLSSIALSSFFLIFSSLLTFYSYFQASSSFFFFGVIYFQTSQRSLSARTQPHIPAAAVLTFRRFQTVNSGSEMQVLRSLFIVLQSMLVILKPDRSCCRFMLDRILRFAVYQF